eukprot:2768720-Alexandrium_andersonii.AAC.1
MLGPPLVLRSSSFERLKRVRAFWDRRAPRSSVGGLRIGARCFALSRPRTPSRPAFAGRFGICT